MTEIKKCPWCGEMPFLHKTRWRWTLLHKCDVIKIVIGLQKSKKDLIEIWNKGVKEND